MRAPGYFIEQAEESRIIEQISEWVFKRVASDLFNDQGFLESQIKVSINLSATDVRLKVFPENLVSFIDDFGTGYSSLNYLRELPVHTVKIDYSFVSEIEYSKKGAALVAAIVGMAHGLGINIIAEGVENTNQSDYLESLGCDTMQGFLFSKPIQVKEFLSTVANQCEDISSLSTA